MIAAIEGYAVAGGLELALWADLRVAAEDAVLGVFCRRWGVPLIDGGTVRLPRLIGQSRAMDLVLTGVRSAQRGARDRAGQPAVRARQGAGAAQALALELAALPQTCLRQDRLSVLEQWGLGEQDALAVELAQGLVSLESDALAGATRFAAGAGRHGAPASHACGADGYRCPGARAGSPPSDGEPCTAVAERSRPGCRTIAWSVAGAALGGDDVAQELLDLGLAVAAVATQSADGGQLAGLGPTRDRLRVHAEHGGHLSRREEGFSFGRSRYHGAPLWYCDSELFALATSVPPALVSET